VVWLWVLLFCFFFKQKTAYEIRPRDWSSDVCSSDPLADEEKRHCAIYSDLYEFYTGKPGEGEELLGEYGKFIQLMIREISEDLVFEDMLSQEDLVSRALQFEKNTLLYFTEVKSLFRGKAGALVDAICREEKRHIQKLLESRQLLRSSTG